MRIFRSPVLSTFHKVPLAQAAGLLTALRMGGVFGSGRLVARSAWLLAASIGQDLRASGKTAPALAWCLAHGTGAVVLAGAFVAWSHVVR